MSLSLYNLDVIYVSGKLILCFRVVNYTKGYFSDFKAIYTLFGSMSDGATMRQEGDNTFGRTWLAPLLEHTGIVSMQGK